MTAYLTSLIEQKPMFSDELGQIKDLHQKKLWHQLTDTIQAFIAKDGVSSAISLVEFYDKVVADFAPRTNQLRLAEIAVSVSHTITSLDERLQFLEKVLGAKYVSDNKEATIVVSSQAAQVEVSAGKLDLANERLEKLDTMLERLPSAEAQVHAALYKAKSAYSKAKRDAPEFYRVALQWLAYEQLEDIEASERATLAFDLGIAALEAPDIYNFGELLEKGVVDVLSSSGNEWLAKVLLSLNQGKIAEWNKLQVDHAAQIKANIGHIALLNQKASILSVIELIFNRGSDARIIPFQDIADASILPLNKVEHLLMKALSLKLIKGRIDQNTATFHVTWVQPRVLSSEQVSLMRDRLYTWRETVDGALGLMQSQISPELLS